MDQDGTFAQDLRQPYGGSPAAVAALRRQPCGSNKMLILGLNKFKLVLMHFEKKKSKSSTVTKVFLEPRRLAVKKPGEFAYIVNF